MTSLFFIWLSLSLIFFLIELGGISLFFFVSFAIGAIFAAMISLGNFSLWVQLITFLLVSFIVFIIMRFVFNPKRYVPHVTNVDVLPGKKGIIITAIAPGMTGQVKIGGEVWTARSFNAEIIFEGASVEVIRVQGCHVIVKPIEKRS